MSIIKIKVIATGFLFFLGMAALGWKVAASSSAGDRNVTSAQVVNVVSKHVRADRASKGRDKVDKQMSAISNAPTQQERLRITIDLVNSLSPEDFSAWVEGDRFSFRKGPELHIFRMILFERWIAEDPDGLIQWALKNNYGQAGRALMHLTANDPQRLISSFRNNPLPIGEEIRMLRNIAIKYPELALERFLELEPKDEHSVRTLFKELSKNSSGLLSANLDRFSENIKKLALEALSGQRLLTSFSTEIRALYENPEGFDIFTRNLNENMIDDLLAEIGNMPTAWKKRIASGEGFYPRASEIRKWLEADLEKAGFSAEEAARLKTRALISSSYYDPELSLAKLSQSDFVISSEDRKRMIANIFNGNRKPEEIEKFLGLLDSAGDREMAMEGVRVAENMSELNTMDSEEVFAALGSSSSPAAVISGFSRLRGLDHEKSAELRSQFSKLPVESQQRMGEALISEGFSNVFREGDRGLVGDVLLAYLSNPPSDRGEENTSSVMTSSSYYAVNLAMDDPAAAASWINKLPEGEAQLWATKNVASNISQYDPQWVDQWLKTLPANTRQQVTEHLRTRR